MEKNRLQVELDRLRGAGSAVLDLIDTNFHRNGIRFPEALLKPLFDGYLAERGYAPDSKGDAAARESISAYYASHGVRLPPADLLITASSSESYNLLFNNLTEPGDNLLLPSPTYPLFEFLAQFNHLEVRSYRMRRRDSYAIDFDSLASSFDERTRFVVLISPNNPTGQIVSETEVRLLLDLCERHGVALIVDEVFSEFTYPRVGEEGTPSGIELPRPAAFDSPVPVFTLNGISKMFACPDLKLGWIGVSGGRAGRAELVETLEVANDVFLSASSLAQHILPGLFAQGGEFVRGMVATLRRRRDLLVSMVAGSSGIDLVPPMGGIHCPLRFSRDLVADDEELALRLLKECSLYLHPGYFYGFEEEAGSLFAVVTFLLEDSRLRDGLGRLLEFVKG